MRQLLSLILIVVSSVVHAAALRLSDNGKTDYVIVLQKNAGAVDKLAARELAFFLKEITGADFPIVETGRSPAIYIGHSKGGSLPDQENVMEVSGKDVFLYGGGIHGNLWAVYEFLENRLGCIFFNAFGDFHAPKSETVTLPDSPVRTAYAFPTRAIMNYFYKDKDLMSISLYRNRQNVLLHSGNHPRFPGKEPGIVCRWETFLGSHSLFRLIPPGADEVRTGYNAGTGFLPALPEFKDRKYFVTNPEFFSMNDKGKRIPNRQLCFSNPDLRRELEKNVRTYYETQKKRTGLDGVIEISCNDVAYQLCLCADCTAQEKEYGTPGAPLILALIEIAERNRDITFRTLAYQRSQTQRPPRKKISIPENLVIIFAPINGDYASPLDGSKENQTDLQDFIGWTELTKNILFWYYPNVANRNPEKFFIEPPNGVGKRFARDFQIMRDRKIQGPYVEHDTGGILFCSNFSELQAWLLLKLAQNPDQDIKKLTATFINAYYGPAAEIILQYHSELEKELENFTAAGGKWNYRTIDAAYLTKENLLHWDALMDKAEKLSDGEFAFRVRLMRMGLDSTIVSKLNDNSEMRIARISRTLQELRKARPVNVNMKKFETWCEKMRSRGKELPLPKEFSSVKDVTVISASENAKTVVPMKDANSGLAYLEKRMPGKPFRMGLYDRGSKKVLLSKVFDEGTLHSSKFDFRLLNDKPVSLTPSTILYGGSWMLNYNVGAECVQRDNAESLERKFYIFVSLKEINGQIYSDRVYVVPADKCPDSLLQPREPGMVPLPESVSGIPGVIRLPVPKKANGAVSEESANCKRALAEAWDGKTPFRIGLYDTKTKQYDGVRLLKEAEIPRDNAWHWIRLSGKGALNISPDSAIFGGKWVLLFRTEGKASPGEKYEIFLSLKLEKNRLLCDSAVLIPADKCPAELK